jgi:hypothetical protein
MGLTLVVAIVMLGNFRNERIVLQSFGKETAGPSASSVHKLCAQGLTVAMNGTRVADDETLKMAETGSRLMLLPRGDGFGTHVVVLLAALAYCRFENTTYVHYPWSSVGHKPTNMSSMDWSTDLQNFIGLSQPELQYSDDLGPVPAVLWLRGVQLAPDTYYTDEFLASMRSRYLGSGYPRTNSPSFQSTHNRLRVAVHIRRGDVERGAMMARYTNNTETAVFMRRAEADVRSQGHDGPVSFHVYSEGVADKFADLIIAFGEKNVFLHLDEDLKTSFHDMVSADVLIMAKSSFSYAAALLSNGTVYAQPFWLKARRQWRLLEPM